MRRGLFAILLVTQLAIAQDRNILAGSPATPIYVETAYEGNANLENCDWYTPVSEFIDANFDDESLFGKNCTVNIRIRGVINQEGASVFRKLVDRLEEAGHKPATIILNSHGGDADAAMEFGRMIRSNRVFNHVSGGVKTKISEAYDAACLSACVVIFAAGYRRELELNIDPSGDLPSRLGIHGPGHYDDKTQRYDTSASNTQIRRVSRALKTYFSSIGIEEKLVDDMFSVPFDEIRLLGAADLASYGMTVN